MDVIESERLRRMKGWSNRSGNDGKGRTGDVRTTRTGSDEESERGQERQRSWITISAQSTKRTVSRVPGASIFSEQGRWPKRERPAVNARCQEASGRTRAHFAIQNERLNRMQM